MKMWQILALIFPAYFHGLIYAIQFEPCFPAVKNEPCNMTCLIPDFLEVIEFTCNSAIRGSCSIAICNGMIKEGNTMLHLHIPSIAYANDDCEWGCTYGANASFLSNITIYSGLSGTLNLTGQQNENGVKLTAVAECLYPYNPTVHVQYSEAEAGPYELLNAQVDLQSSTSPGGCSNAIERRVTAVSDVSANHQDLAGKSVFFKMIFSQYQFGPVNETIVVGPFSFNGLTISSSTINSDMSTTVSKAPPPLVTTSSAGLSQEIVITITISSSILALGVLILLIVLVVKQCKRKNRQTPEKSNGNRFATKQSNFSKKDDLKSSIKTRKSKFSEKRNTKQENISLDKFEHTQAPKDRMYEHYPQTTDYMFWNNSGNQHVFNHSHTERNMIKYGYQHDRYPKPLSGPNNRMMYQSCYPEHPRHNERMFQYYRADKLYQEQQMYQMPFAAQYDDYIKNKPENKRFEERTYERNWDFLY